MSQRGIVMFVFLKYTLSQWHYVWTATEDSLVIIRTERAKYVKLFKILVRFVFDQTFIWSDWDNFFELFGYLCNVAVIHSSAFWAFKRFDPVTPHYFKRLPWEWYTDEACTLQSFRRIVYFIYSIVLYSFVVLSTLGFQNCTKHCIVPS